MLVESVADLASYAAVLEHQETLVQASGHRRIPVLSDGLDMGERDDAQSLHRARLDRKTLYGLFLSARISDGIQNTLPSCCELQYPVRSTIVVIEDDEASLVGVMLAAVTRRSLHVWERAELLSKLADPSLRSVTLVIGNAMLDFQLLEGLCALHGEPSAGRVARTLAIMTASSLPSLSRLAHRSLRRMASAERRTHLAVLQASNGSERIGSDSPSRSVLLNAGSDTLSRNLLRPDDQYGTVSFLGHGREYCTRLGTSTLCSRGEDNQGNVTCINGMDCFDPTWLRLSPHTIRADGIFVNSCSVFKPSTTAYDYDTTLGLDFLNGMPIALISTFQVEQCTPLESYLFHALAEQGYSLAEMCYLLNRSSHGHSRFIAVGDADLRLDHAAGGPHVRPASVNCIAPGYWLLDGPPTTEEPDDGVREVESAELFHRVTRGDVALFRDEDPRVLSGDEQPSGAIIPGLTFPHVLVYARGVDLSRGPLILIGRDYASLQHLHRLLSTFFAKHAALHCCYDLSQYPFSTVEQQAWEIRSMVGIVASSQRRRILPLRALYNCVTAYEELSAMSSQMLVTTLKRRHCGDVVNFETLQEAQTHYDELCPYCTTPVSHISYDSALNPPPSLNTGICPVCGIIFYRTLDSIVSTVLCRDVYPKDQNPSIQIGIEVYNGEDVPITISLALTLFPQVRNVADFEILPDVVTRKLDAGSSEIIEFQLVLPDGLPRNVYVVQCVISHDFGIDFASRYIRIT